MADDRATEITKARWKQTRNRALPWSVIDSWQDLGRDVTTADIFHPLRGIFTYQPPITALTTEGTQYWLFGTYQFSASSCSHRAA